MDVMYVQPQFDIDITRLRESIEEEMRFKNQLMGYHKSEVENYIASQKKAFKKAQASFQESMAEMKTTNDLLLYENESNRAELEKKQAEITALTEKCEQYDKIIRETEDITRENERLKVENGTLKEAKLRIGELETVLARMTAENGQYKKQLEEIGEKYKTQLTARQAIEEAYLGLQKESELELHQNKAKLEIMMQRTRLCSESVIDSLQEAIAELKKIPQ